MMSAASLAIASNPCYEHSCHNMHLTADLGLVSGCEDLNPTAQTVRNPQRPRSSRRP